MLIIGGRNQDNIDSIPLKSFDCIQLPQFDSTQFDVLNSSRFKLHPVKTTFRLHASVTIGNWVILHGGRVFNKMRDDALGTELFLYDSSCSRWYAAKVKGISS